MAISKDDVIEFISNMTVLELSDLVKELEDKFGVSAAAPVAVAAAGAVAGEEGGVPAEEQTEFDVVLVEFGSQKIKVIKEIRAVTSLGLKEAKDLVESAPKSIKEGISKEEAEKIKEQVEKVGAKVEIK
jgi:large subunit ribosomal protein L7/L12